LKEKRKQATLNAYYKNEDLEVVATLCGREFGIKTSATFARFEMPQDGPESEDEHKKPMDEQYLICKNHKNGKPNISRRPPKRWCKSWTLISQRNRLSG